MVQKLSLALMSWFVLLALGALLTAVNEIYTTLDISMGRPIKGYVQIAKLIIYAVGGIIIISSLLGRSPLVLLSGFGALTAVILLIFRDTILSFVASLQITSNDLVRIGDWIEVPGFGADGDVVDIALHTVKIQNWDKTFTVIPTHKLIDVTFKNWRGMQMSGGRRIKRAVHLDLGSVKFCDDDMIEEFKRFDLISDYVKDRQDEIKRYNKEMAIDTSVTVNGRRMTNIGTFRAYVEAYLRSNKKIHQDMTFLVRQLPPGPTGLPIEIYVFTNDTAWAHYEAIQADIFDHILAVVPHFFLRVFQNPAGEDFQRLGASAEALKNA
jgi:miniconductance mechanosensitive channel